MTNDKQRERLIELRRQARKLTKNANSDIERDMIFADYLLANGVIVPPHKVGTRVYVVVSRTSNNKNLYIVEDVITHYRIFDDCMIMCFVEHLGLPDYKWGNVFLTQEEAEQALVNYGSSKKDIERKEDNEK
jgi:hypothetical protein